MSQRLDNKVGACAPDNLINSPTPAADVFSVTIRKLSAAATLKRGTVLAHSSSRAAADGKMVILGTEAHKTSGAADEVLTANCVLCDDVEVGTTDDVVAVAYRTGHFNRNQLIVASGYTLKASDEEDLRKCGILLSDAFAG